MKDGLKLAGAAIVVGLGPEDPVADFVAGLIVVGTVAQATSVWLGNILHSSAGSDEGSRTAQDVISKDRKGTINIEFPGQYLNKTLKEIQDPAKAGEEGAKKALKLIRDGRFSK